MQTSACAWGLGSANPLINLSHGCTGAPKEGPGLAGPQGLRLPSGSSWFAGDTEKGELRPMQRRGWGVTRQWLGEVTATSGRGPGCRGAGLRPWRLG